MKSRDEAMLVGAELELQHARSLAIQTALRLRDLEYVCDIGLIDEDDDELCSVREAFTISAALYRRARAAHSSAMRNVQASAARELPTTERRPMHSRARSTERSVFDA